MQFEDGPQLPLTQRRKVLVALGAAMALTQIIVAALAAPVTTGDRADAGVLAALWAGSAIWSAASVLLLVRQADLPDVATASFLVTIPTFAVYALVAAVRAHDTDPKVNIVDAMFLGITVGAMTALFVWAIAMGIARLLRLPTTAELRKQE